MQGGLSTGSKALMLGTQNITWKSLLSKIHAVPYMYVGPPGAPVCKMWRGNQSTPLAPGLIDQQFASRGCINMYYFVCGRFRADFDYYLWNTFLDCFDGSSVTLYVSEAWFFDICWHEPVEWVN